MQQEVGLGELAARGGGGDGDHDEGEADASEEHGAEHGARDGDVRSPQLGRLVDGLEEPGEARVDEGEKVRELSVPHRVLAAGRQEVGLEGGEREGAQCAGEGGSEGEEEHDDDHHPDDVDGV